MRVGLAQMNIIWENKEQNMLKVIKCLEQFASSRCSKPVGNKEDTYGAKSDNDIIFFPEMSLTGFSMNTVYTSESCRETVRECERLAREYGVSIGIGWTRYGNPLCENHYSIVNSEKGEVLDYTKLHPFSYSGENDYFRGGDSLSACCIGNMRFGTAICFDLRFPEIFQILSDSVDLIAVPANWPERRRKHWLTLLEARAIENQCYIAGVNCCGMINDTYYSGDSCIFGPDGELIRPSEAVTLDINCPEEKLLVYDIENNKVQEVRQSFPIKSDRKNELYRTIKVNELV